MKYKYFTYSILALCLLCLGFSILLILSASEPRPPKIDAKILRTDDLSFLKEELKGKTIVMLGESLHADGTTFSSKTEIVKYLCDTLGFNTLLFEAGLYDMKDFDPEHPEKSLWPFWAESVQLNNLWKYTKDSGIRIGGIDCQFSGDVPDSARCEELFSLFDSYGIEYSVTQKALRRALWCMARGLLDCFSDSDTLKLMFNEMDAATAILPDGYGRMYVNGLKNTIRYQFLYGVGDDRRIHWRDSIMYENTVWHLEKGDKTIIWCANMHASKEYYRNRLNKHTDYKNLGYRLHDKYGDSLYVILYDNWGRKLPLAKRPYYLPKTNSFEYALHLTYPGQELYITDLNRMPPMIISRVFEAEFESDISNMADAVVFIDIMENAKYNEETD